MQVTIESGVFDVSSERQNYQTSTVPLLGIPLASGVLFTHRPSVVESSAQQSNPFAGGTNRVSLAFSLDVDLLAVNSSAITVRKPQYLIPGSQISDKSPMSHLIPDGGDGGDRGDRPDGGDGGDGGLSSDRIRAPWV